MFAIRGATTIEADDRELIFKATEELIQKIIEFNSVEKNDIISIVFSCTRDLKSAYPAEAVRNMGIVNATLFCTQEMYVENSLKRCIRVLILLNGNISQKDVRHVYLKGAKILRQDLKML